MYVALPERVRPHVQQTTLREWCAAPEDELAEALARLHKEHGSVDNYLDSIGLDEGFRAALRARLTVAPPEEA